MLDKDDRLSEEAMNRTIETSDVAPLASRSIGDTAPTILGFFPQTGRPGDLITITGANLGSVTSVTFNGVPASGFTTAPTILKAIVSSRATTGPIQVSGPTGEATSFGSFTVMQGAPSIIGTEKGTDLFSLLDTLGLAFPRARPACGRSHQQTVLQ